MDLPDQLVDLLRAQDGIAHRRQLLEGMTRAELRWATSRRWQYVLPGVIATFTGRLDGQQRLIAATLFAGDDAVLTSTTAARWRGLVSVAGDPTIHLVVPACRSGRRTGVVLVRRTVRPDDQAWRRGPLLIASPGRAVADAARDAVTERQAMAVVVEAAQKNLVTPAALLKELQQGPRLGSTQLRAGIEAALGGAWSVPEHSLLQTLARSRKLPEVWANPALVVCDGTALPAPDGWIDDVALAIQVHSRRHHAFGDDWEGTVMRDGIFGEYRIPLVAFTPRRIETDPPWVLQRVERVYAALRDVARPNVQAYRTDAAAAVGPRPQVQPWGRSVAQRVS